MKTFISYIKTIIVTIIITFVITHFIILPAVVPSGSMISTLEIGDNLIGNRLAYLFSNPERGDIITFYAPDDESVTYVKRIIGIPGDIVEIKNGMVIVNGIILEEPYLNEPMNKDSYCKTFEVPENSYFCLGDNRNHSLDSRYWNNPYVKKNKITSKIVLKYFNSEQMRFNFKFL